MTCQMLQQLQAVCHCSNDHDDISHGTSGTQVCLNLHANNVCKAINNWDKNTAELNTCMRNKVKYFALALPSQDDNVMHTCQISLGVDDCLLLAILTFVIKNFTFKPH